MNLEKLDEPFPENDIEWRVQQGGHSNNGNPWAMVLAYVTNRAIMKRLDDVCGKAGWKNEYLPAPNGGLMCGISIKIGDEWVTKWDGADNTQVEAVKGGMSGAMKRAAVQWGIGRYLYALEANFAQCSGQNNGGKKHYDKNAKKAFWWQPPSLPEWALPKAELISSGQVEKLQEAISGKGYTVEQACGAFQIQSLSAIPADQFNCVMQSINNWSNNNV